MNEPLTEQELHALEVSPAPYVTAHTALCLVAEVRRLRAENAELAENWEIHLQLCVDPILQRVNLKAIDDRLAKLRVFGGWLMPTDD